MKQHAAAFDKQINKPGAGTMMSDYLQERVLDPVGIEGFSWDVHGGSGALGPLTNAHTGVHISARELARFGYLALHGGAWNGQQIVPAWWMRSSGAASRSTRCGTSN